MVVKVTATTSETSTDERAGLLRLHSCNLEGHGSKIYACTRDDAHEQWLVIRELAYDLEA